MNKAREISEFYTLNIINPEDLLPVSEPLPEDQTNLHKKNHQQYKKSQSFNLNHQNPFHQYNQYNPDN
jgi:hypothetical protein